MLSTLILFLLALTHPQNALAVTRITTPTVIPSPTLAVTATPTPGNFDEIQKIRQAVQEKVKEKLKEITAPDTNVKKAVIGTISSITDTSLTISYQNQSYTINTSKDTVFVDQKRSKSSLSKLTEGQDVLAMGTQTSPGIIDAKRVVVIDIKSLFNPTATTLGHIADISKSSPIIVLIPGNNKNTQYQIKYDTKTVISDRSDKKLSSDSLYSGQKVITIIAPDDKTPHTYYASRIIVLDQKAKVTLSPTPTAHK